MSVSKIPLSFSSFRSGYAFNIQMLRRLFTPELNVLSIKRTGALEITTRRARETKTTPPQISCTLADWQQRHSDTCAGFASAGG